MNAAPPELRATVNLTVWFTLDEFHAFTEHAAVLQEVFEAAASDTNPTALPLNRNYLSGVAADMLVTAVAQGLEPTTARGRSLALYEAHMCGDHCADAGGPRSGCPKCRQPAPGEPGEGSGDAP